MTILPTCVPKDAADLFACLSLLGPLASCVHVDVDDGIFAKPLTWPYVEPGIYGDIDARLLQKTQISAHLMVSNPYEIGLSLANAGARAIIVHVEALERARQEQAMSIPEASPALKGNLLRGSNQYPAQYTKDMRKESKDPAPAVGPESFVSAWRAAGARTIGVAILIDTPLGALDPYVQHADFALVMSVDRIGEQCSAFDTRAIARIEELHKKYPHLTIACDGGINESTIKSVVHSGADILYVGAAISRSDDPAASYQRLQKQAVSGIA